MQPTSLRFAAVSRALTAAAQRQGLVVPSFKSPPAPDHAVRTIRRSRLGGVTVSVAIHGRPWGAVIADMVDGVTAANGLEGSAAAAWREDAWGAVEGDARARAA